MVRKYLLATLGCKVNQYESEQVREVLELHGFQPAQRHDVPDIAVVNTCAVTAGASRKNRQAIRRVSRGGRTPVVVVGCGATADAQSLRTLSGVTAVLGHDLDVCAELRKLLVTRLEAEPNPLAAFSADRAGSAPPVTRNDLRMNPVSDRPAGDAPTTFPAAPLESLRATLPLVKRNSDLTARIESFAGHQRAFLKVQDGCDAFCTYCIIPRLRPALRSKPIDVALAEACDLVKTGHKELVLTGIFLGSYGRETAVRRRWAPPRSKLPALVDAIARVRGLERLRLSSLEPGDVDDALLDVLTRHRCCVPHLHLPLQSGSDRILRRMNRQYTRDAFLNMIDRVRGVLDHPAITTDVIVGFPGETDEDFEASLEIARYAGFCKIHAFPFSPREKTAAARWTAQFVDPTTVHRRMQRLAEVERELSIAFRRQFIGCVERVIVETTPESDDGVGLASTLRWGRTDRYFEVHFDADGLRPGHVAAVRIDRVTPTRSHGTHLPGHGGVHPLAVLPAS
jgi:threonylcarbamoyladenosine tRNA methylthiotransferase MtaB